MLYPLSNELSVPEDFTSTTDGSLAFMTGLGLVALTSSLSSLK